MSAMADRLDTIVALATPTGPGARAIIRLTGPATHSIVNKIFTPATSKREPKSGQQFVEGMLHWPTLSAPGLPSQIYAGNAPNTYTGQHLCEIHTISSSPLVETLVAVLLSAGARAAQPGEFTMRAFLAGKLDLTRAEAVLGVIEANDRDELKVALSQLAGGVARPLQTLRDDLLNLLADIEAALDFADEDITFVTDDDILKRLGTGLAQVTLLGRQLDRRGLAGRPFRVVLAGRPNTGKSSLFNALVGESAALVSAQPGTTRDYVARRLHLGDCDLELIDTAGLRSESDAIEMQAQSLGSAEADRADLVLLCVEAGSSPSPYELALLAQQYPPALGVATKTDLLAAGGSWLSTSATTGGGLIELRQTLRVRVQERAEPAMAPSLSRCKHHVEECLAQLRRAHAIVIEQMPRELLALELRGALEQLGEMVGTVYTDDLLDRIFSRFCVGK